MTRTVRESPGSKRQKMRMPRPFVAIAILADAGALLMTRRTSRRRPQLRARADADEAEELRRIFESGADLLTPEEEMANEDAREGAAVRCRLRRSSLLEFAIDPGLPLFLHI